MHIHMHIQSDDMQMHMHMQIDHMRSHMHMHTDHMRVYMHEVAGGRRAKNRWERALQNRKETFLISLIFDHYFL